MSKKRAYSTKGILIRNSIMLIILVGGIIAFFLARYLKKALQDRIISAYSVNVEYQVKQFEKFEEEIRQYANVIVSSNELQNALSQSRKGHESVEAKYLIQRELSQYISLYGNLVMLEIETEEGVAFCSEFFNKTYYPEEVENEIKDCFSAIHNISSADRRVEEQVLTYYFPFYSFSGQDTYMLKMYIRAEAVGNVIDGTVTEQGNINWVALMEGEKMLYPSIKDLPIDEKMQEKIRQMSVGEERVWKQKNEYILSSWTKDGEKVLFMSVTDRDIREEFERAYVVYAIILLAALLLGTFFILVFSERFTRPIRDLSTAVQRIANGEKSVQVTVSDNREIAFLQTVFNQMSTEIERQMSEIVKAEKEHNRLHNEILISQINPHFIYNTLNDAIYLIGAKQNEDAICMIRSFISLLQRNLKAGVDGIIASVSDELTSIVYYCAIQKIRYPERFQIFVDCEETLKDRSIPRMLLQPIVENALYHGILPSLESGRIDIRIYLEGSDMILEIEDDGIGIDEKLLMEIGKLKVRKGTSQMYSIGLSNVKERLKMFYGDNYRMQIISPPEGGTLVKMVLPLQFN